MGSDRLAHLPSPTRRERLAGWLLEGTLNSPLQIEEGVTALTQAMQQTRSELVRYRKTRSQPKPWFTPAVRAAHKRLWKAKSELTKAQRRSPDGQAPWTVATNYRNSRQAFEALVKITKQACFQDFCERMHPHIDMWDKFRQVCGTRRTEPIPALQAYGQTITDPRAKAELLLLAFFPEASPTTTAPKTTSMETTQSARPPALSAPITFSELFQTIASARHSAPGRDKIPVLCWQACSSLLIPILHRLYNGCLTEGYYPRAWRHAQIVPLPKGTKKRSCPSSWRPISLLCNAGKFLEKIIQKRLTSFLEQSQALSPTQHGFRRHRSTESAFHVLAEATLGAFNRRKQLLSVGLDISKAFDFVPHPHLLRRLETLNAPNYIVTFVRAFLTDRTATLSLENEALSVNVPHGVPHGSSLSPTLFLTYIDSLAQPIQPPVRLLMFADDCLLFQEIGRQAQDAAPMQQALLSLERWSSQRQLTFNAMKSQCCRFRRIRRTHPVRLQQSSILLEERPSIRYLGTRHRCCMDIHRTLQKQEDSLPAPAQSNPTHQPLVLGHLPPDHQETPRHVHHSCLPIRGLAVWATVQRTILQTTNLGSNLPL